ncbi:hypothetical protein CVT24_002603, partial [Panaeolus cyanescens]
MNPEDLKTPTLPRPLRSRGLRTTSTLGSSTSSTGLNTSLNTSSDATPNTRFTFTSSTSRIDDSSTPNANGNGNALRTPMTSTTGLRSSSGASGIYRTPSSSLKRDSLAAELERDPHLSSSKRTPRSTLLTSLTASSLERQLLQAQQSANDALRQVAEKERVIERLEKEK